MFAVVFHEVYCFHISKYDEVYKVTLLYLSAMFHAVANEIPWLNQKMNLQCNTFPSHVIDPYCTGTFDLVKSQYTTIKFEIS